MSRRGLAALLVGSAIAAALAAARLRGKSDEGARCGPGFEAHGTRCLVPQDGARGCPAPLVTTPHGCDAPEVRVLVAATMLPVGSSDWEAEGRIPPRTLRVPAFRIDAFEVTRGRMGLRGDPARAASAIDRATAAAFCAAAGGRLPTEDEWMAAAASAMAKPHRYPWGNTGAVCRRAAWGLKTGPCAESADGPDTVGAHRDGDSPLGLHDLAGNVAEWVMPSSAESASARRSGDARDRDRDGDELQDRTNVGVAKGGSWASTLASDLRVWSRLELAQGSHDARVGFRCAYRP